MHNFSEYCQDIFVFNMNKSLRGTMDDDIELHFYHIVTQ